MTKIRLAIDEALTLFVRLPIDIVHDKQSQIAVVFDIVEEDPLVVYPVTAYEVEP